MRPFRLVFITSHPIQYHTPWFRALASSNEIDLEVLFCHQATTKDQAAAGFGVEFDWDISLLQGYPYRFLKNVARQPSVAGFSGIDTPEVKEIIGTRRFDAVMINGWHFKSAWQAMRACWHTKTPVMVRSDSHLHTQRTGLKRAAKWPFYSWFISKLDACLPVGTWSSEYFLHYGAKPERVFVVPHVVDTDYFAMESQRLEPQRTALRAGWGLKPSSTVFLFAGKFIAKKRPLDFVKAIEEANSRGAEIEGLMVGDGPLRETCEELVRATDLPIKFAGFLNQTEIAAAYVAANFLVLPSDGGETWGLVVNEAMACGLPCFVSDRVGCGPDMIIPSQNGDVFPLGDTNALAKLMSESASSHEPRSSVREKAKEQGQKYTARFAVDRTIEALRKITK